MNKYINAGLIIGVLAAIYFFIIRPIRPPATKGQKKQTKMIENAFLNVSDYFNPDYYKKFVNYKPAPDMEKRAERIYKAIHPPLGGTNEVVLFTEFEKLPSKADLSYLAEKYLEKYNISLKADVNADLNERDLKKLVVGIENKPKTKSFIVNLTNKM